MPDESIESLKARDWFAVEPPMISVRGGFVKSYANQVAIIRVFGFNTQITVFRTSARQYETPLTILVENLRGHEITVEQQGGCLSNLMRAENSIMFELTGLRVQKILLTASPPPAEFDFFFVGDIHGVFQHLQDIVQAAKAQPPLFILSNGDLTHSGRLREYHTAADILSYANVPVFTSLGNHDKRTRGGRKTYASVFAPLYYAFTVHNTKFIVLDSSRKRGLPRFQYKWLERELQIAADKRIFVILHRPPVCPKYNYLAFSASLNANRFLALMAEYHVETVFSSHVHVFTEFEERGVRYVVTGGGGGALWKPANVHHYLHVTVKASGVAIRVVNLPTPAANVSQRLKDVIKFHIDYQLAYNRRLRELTAFRAFMSVPHVRPDVRLPRLWRRLR